MKKLINRFLSYLNIQVVKKSSFNKLLVSSRNSELFELLKVININYKIDFLNWLNQSKSELGQDLFVLSQLKFKKNGFFVEFGATNGLDSSNTYLMETKFEWQGILAEPAKIFHQELKKNRNSNIETNCVWRTTGETLDFKEDKHPSLSGVSSFLNDSFSSRYLAKFQSSYSVQTISLEDLLKKFNAPNIIDYLSIDTEGSEFDILNSFNFEKYKFRIITCEHNYKPNREKIYSLLTKNSYKRVFADVSKWDDFYIHSDQS